MKTIMKKGIIFFGLMIVSTIIFAQRTVDPMERAAKQADKMKTELSLDDVQYKAVKAINEEYADKQIQVRRDSALSKESRYNKMRTLHHEKNAALKKVLTEEQHKKLVASRTAHANKHNARMARRHSDRAQRMQKNLSLTDEQTAKIKAIDKEFADKFRLLRGDSTLAKEDSRVRARQLREEYQSRTKSVLSEEQLKKWESQKAEHKRKKF
jgi:Spy/CpxP family protein refolding chaperone